jgi:predicted amidohydrolase
MKIAAVQGGVKRGDVAANLAAAIGWIRNAAADGNALVVLPECFLTGYIFESREEVAVQAVSLDGPEIAAIVEACGAGRIHAVVGTFEKRGSKLHNTAVLIGPEGLVGLHRKNHLPYLGGDRFIDLPDESGTSVFETPVGTIGIAICYEIRFPEVVRTLMLEGAEVIALPTNWPVASLTLAQHFTVVRAAENMVYFLAANRNDDEGGTSYLGWSRIIDPYGEVLADAGTETALISAEVDLDRARHKKIVFEAGKFELNPIRDRRPEAYRL